MDYFSEIVEDDSTLVLNTYDNYEEIFEDDSLDSHSVKIATTNLNEIKRDDNQLTQILGDLHDAEAIVAKLLAKSDPKQKTKVEANLKQRKSSSAPTTPVRPSSAGPLRSSRSKGLNVNRCHRMLSAYGVTMPVVDARTNEKLEDSLIKIDKQTEEEAKKMVKQAHRSVPSSPTKSSILAWTDSYSLDSTSRIGFSNAYDYNYHNGTAPFVIVDPEASHSTGPDTVEINSQLAIRRMNAKNHIQRSSSDNAMRKGSKHNKDDTDSLLLNNYQIQSFDIEDSDVNYLVFDTKVKSRGQEEEARLDEVVVEPFVSSSKSQRRKAKTKQQNHKLVHRMERSLLNDDENHNSVTSDHVPFMRLKENKNNKNVNGSQSSKNRTNNNNNISSSDSLEDSIDFIVSDVFSIIFDKLLHDFLSIIVRQRPHSSSRGFRCGTFQVRKTLAPSSPTRPSDGKSPVSPTQQQQLAKDSTWHPQHPSSDHATAASVVVVNSPAEEVRPRKYSDRLSYFVASHSVRSSMMRLPGANSTNHTSAANDKERAKVIDNFTYVNKDRVPLPHVKQLMYDLQMRINAHKSHS